MTVRDRAGAALFTDPSVSLERRPDGSMILRSDIPVSPSANHIGEWLRHWAESAPDRLFLAERATPDQDWTRLTYGEAFRQVRVAGAWILGLELSSERPLAILSDNSIDHGLLALGAMCVGAPVATISPAYSLMSSDHKKLTAMIEHLNPGAIYVSDTDQYAAALAAIAGRDDCVIVASKDSGGAVTSFAQVLNGTADSRVDAAFDAVTPDTIARFLFTSGSTGTPKAVINTHGMLTSNQQARATVWPFLETTPPVVVDWLPWSHTFGANHNFNMVLRNGGTMYIDAGRPAPHLAHITAANIKEIGPNLCFNVPRGYAMLIEALKEDRELSRKFFSNVQAIFYAGAALPQNLWEALEHLSTDTVGRSTPMVSGWGSTETAPLATDCHFQADQSGNIGVPAPGVELKLLPNAGKLEIRVRGPNVTPGYWKQPELTKAAFDEEGFYLIGDAVRFADPDHPEKGLFFDGRVAEDFKLSSGTFVNVGQLRVDAITALDPVAQDIVLTGHDCDAVGFLIFPNVPACRKIAGLPEDASVRAVLDYPAVRSVVQQGLAVLKRAGGGSSRYAARARLMEQPAAVDQGEITDKGYINQRAVLQNRAGEIELLNGSDPSAYVSLN